MAIDEQQTITFAGTEYELRYLSLDGATAERGGWDPAQEERNARAAIAEHDCIAYIGTYNSGAAKISMPILNRAEMLMISPGNTYPGLTKPGTGIGDEPWIYSPLGPTKRNYCRVVPADDLQAPAAARYAAEVLGVQSVYIFHDTESYGRGLADLFADTARSAGITIVNGDPIGVGRTVNAESFAAEIALNEPDLVYFGGTTSTAVTAILRNLRLEGYDGYFMGADGIAEENFISDASAQNDNHLLATLVGLPPTELDSEAGQAWYENYKEQVGDEPDAFAAPSYEAAQVVIRALASVPVQEIPLVPSDADFLERARPLVLASVKSLRDFNGVLGTWSFDENCDTSSTTISILQAENGEFEFVTVTE
jgi:branched-chain amino acid transport system substrate-binding protein